ncbi:hypothetical protein JCM10207_004214 [Rhodosporidiobolus poonsookiae]
MPSVAPASSTAPSPRLSAAGTAKLQAALDSFADRVPGCFLFVGSGDELLFKGLSGKYDMMEDSADARQVDEDTIYWFASTTKLLAALQLIERGVLSSDTPVSKYFPQVKTPFKLIKGVNPATEEPIFEECTTEITVAMLMNQTGGFGDEFGDKIRPWKAWTKVGAGFTNSCQKANLINVPPTEVPGTRFQYGNCSEWLGLVIQEATGKDLDDVFQAQIFTPLGMKSTTFYPFSPEKKPHLMPLRWHNSPEDVKAGAKEWVELTDQQPILTLPRSREEIEYPVGGGGIYSAPRDYHTLLRHILRHFTAGSGSSILDLTAESIASLFKPSLPTGAHETDGSSGWSDYFLQKYCCTEPTEIDWSTGLCILNCKEEQMGGWGRSRGSAGWSGAPGIEYYMDPVKNIAFLCGTNFLPMRGYPVEEFKTTMEKLVNEVIELA